MPHQYRKKCQVSITEETKERNYQKIECHLICTPLITMNSNSTSFPCFSSEGILLPLKLCITQNLKSVAIMNYVSSSAVGWCGPISRLGRAPKRHPDVMAPHYCQALPHTAVWVFQPRHPGGSSWGSTEPSRWQLEGKSCAIVVLKSSCNRLLIFQYVSKCALKEANLGMTIASQMSPNI